MTNKFKDKEDKDENFIDMKESWDVNFWCEELNVKVEELHEIVREVGPSIQEVRLHLAKRLLANWPVAF